MRYNARQQQRNPTPPPNRLEARQRNIRAMGEILLPGPPKHELPVPDHSALHWLLHWLARWLSRYLAAFPKPNQIKIRRALPAFELANLGSTWAGLLAHLLARYLGNRKLNFNILLPMALCQHSISSSVFLFIKSVNATLIRAGTLFLLMVAYSFASVLVIQYSFILGCLGSWQGKIR